mgnify:CR=1 FL=1
MEILKTSQLLKVMHEDDEDFDVHNFNYQMELDILFNMFASNRRSNSRPSYVAEHNPSFDATRKCDP